jgi:hypothetical protein
MPVTEETGPGWNWLEHVRYQINGITGRIPLPLKGL